MTQTKETLYPETSLFVEALGAVLRAEEKVRDSFCLYYSKGEEERRAIDLLESLGITPSFNTIIEELKTHIGDTIQEGIWGHLPSQRKEEGV